MSRSQRVLVAFGLCMMLLVNWTGVLAGSCSHPSSKWIIDKESRDVTIGIVWERKYCNACNAVLDSKLKSLPMHDGYTFCFTPNEFAERFQKIADVLKRNYDGEAFNTTMGVMQDGQLICTVRNNAYDGVAGIQFMDTKAYLNDGEQDKDNISCIMAFLLSDDPAEQVGIMMNVILTCDNTLEVSDASQIAKKAFLSSGGGKPYKCNDIGYAFSPLGNGYLFVASLVGD